MIDLFDFNLRRITVYSYIWLGLECMNYLLQQGKEREEVKAGIKKKKKERENMANITYLWGGWSALAWQRH